MEKQKAIWSQYEDKALKELRINRNILKWSSISKILVQEFSIKGKSGKRCRERFQNCLDQQVKKINWSLQEQELLIKLHNQKGNKWAEISKILERSDNSVKNHFHSKLRKAIRRINSKISLYFKSELKLINNNIISKIIQTAQQIYTSQSHDSQKYTQGSLCYTLKNRILNQLQGGLYNLEQSQLKDLRDLVFKLNNFNKNYKRKSKKQVKSINKRHFKKSENLYNYSVIQQLQKKQIKKQNSKESQSHLNYNSQIEEVFSKKYNQNKFRNELNEEKHLNEHIQEIENDGTKYQSCQKIINQQVVLNNIQPFYRNLYYYHYSTDQKINWAFNSCYGYSFYNFYNPNFFFNGLSNNQSTYTPQTFSLSYPIFEKFQTSDENNQVYQVLNGQPSAKNKEKLKLFNVNQLNQTNIQLKKGLVICNQQQNKQACSKSQQ